MKFLFFAIDTASSGAIISLDAHAKQAGHDCETLIYTRNKPLEHKIVARYKAANISHFISRASIPVSVKAFFTDKSVRKGARFRDILLAGSFYAVLRGVRSFKKILGRKNEGFFGDNGIRILSYFLMIQADFTTANKILEERKIDVLLLSHDYIGHFSSILAKVAKQKNIPVVIVPSLFSEPDKIFEIYKKRPELQIETRVEKYVARKWPKWVYDAPSGVRVTRLEWWRVVFLTYFGLSTPHPWVHQMCDSDLICLPDERLREAYIRLGFPDDKLVVTGNSVQDQLRNFKVVGKKGKKPKLVVALPPDQFVGEGQDFRYTNFNDLLSDLQSVLERVRSKYNIVLSVHPKEKPDKYAILQQAGFTFTDKSTLEILPSADVYLSYAGSSTNNWAYWARVANIQWDPFGYLPEIAEEIVKSATHSRVVGVVEVVEVTNMEALVAGLVHLSQQERREILCEGLPKLASLPTGQGYFDRVLAAIAQRM